MPGRIDNRRDEQETRVVVVEDNDAFRGALRALLHADGIAVVGEAPGGAEAVRIVESTRPDVVLLDMGLPDTPGRDVLGELARIAPATKVVVLSGSDRRADEQAALRAGAVSYVLKGSASDSITAAIRAAVAG